MYSLSFKIEISRFRAARLRSFGVCWGRAGNEDDDFAGGDRPGRSLRRAGAGGVVVRAKPAWGGASGDERGRGVNDRERVQRGAAGGQRVDGDDSGGK